MRRPSLLFTGAMLGQGSFSPGLGPLGDMAAGPLTPVLSPSGETSGKGDDMHGKVRKPYTITKQRENWTEQEHNKFLKALELFDRDWRKIEEYVGTKTVIQIRSHAQKYFLKVQKLGQDAHVPPPRPKRKSSQPYPQKASKVVAAAQAAQQAAVASSKYSPRDGAYTPGGTHPAVPPQSPQEEAGTMGAPAWGPDTPSKANPDFAKVYRFLGDVFEIGVAGNLQKLKCMPPIDRETIILLMRNLAINLASPVFAEQQHILALADSSARSKQLEEPAQPRMIEPESQSAPPTPSDASVTPGEQDDLVAAGAPFLDSPGYRDGLQQQQSPLYEQDGRGGARASSFSDGVPLGLGLGLGVSKPLQRDTRTESSEPANGVGG